MRVRVCVTILILFLLQFLLVGAALVVEYLCPRPRYALHQALCLHKISPLDRPCGSEQTPNKLYMLTEYIVGGELFLYLKNEHRFDPDVVRFYAAEIVRLGENEGAFLLCGGPIFFSFFFSSCASPPSLLVLVTLLFCSLPVNRRAHLIICTRTGRFIEISSRRTS